MMMKTLLFVLTLTLGYQIAPSTGFIPNKLVETAARALSFSLEDAITHEDMTRSAHLEVAAEVLRDNPNPSDRQESSQRLSALSDDFDEDDLITAYYGYHDHTRIDEFENAIEAIEEANSDTDFGEEEYVAAAHFDSEQFESGQSRLINLRNSIISSIMAGDVGKAREDTGRFLHALQDFYSHTNWIENDNQAPNPVLGQPDQKIENTAGPTQQTCTDCVEKGWLLTYYECNDNIDPYLITNQILTSGYAQDQTDDTGRVINKPIGKCSHGGYSIDATRDTSARGGINKDGPYYRTSPHHYLHYEAVAVAQQATIDMFRDVRTAVNNDQLFGTYLGVFLSQAAVESMALGNGLNLQPMKTRRKQLPTADESLLLQYAKQVNGKYLYIVHTCSWRKTVINNTASIRVQSCSS
jgi:hypothetical protein